MRTVKSVEKVSDKMVRVTFEDVVLIEIERLNKEIIYNDSLIANADAQATARKEQMIQMATARKTEARTILDAAATTI